MLWDKILQLFDHVKNYILTNLADWMIGAIVAFISVRIATRDYYIENRLEVAKRIMEQTLSELLEIKYNQKMPSQAQGIMVKYGGRCFVVDERSKCKFGEKIRKTVAVVGGNTSDVSRIMYIRGTHRRLYLPTGFCGDNSLLLFGMLRPRRT